MHHHDEVSCRFLMRQTCNRNALIITEHAQRNTHQQPGAAHLTSVTALKYQHMKLVHVNLRHSEVWPGYKDSADAWPHVDTGNLSFCALSCGAAVPPGNSTEEIRHHLSMIWASCG